MHLPLFSTVQWVGIETTRAPQVGNLIFGKVKSPPFPPLFPRRGVVGDNIDKCIAVFIWPSYNNPQLNILLLLVAAASC